MTENHGEEITPVMNAAAITRAARIRVGTEFRSIDGLGSWYKSISDRQLKYTTPSEFYLIKMLSYRPQKGLFERL